jgi:hypothetical protein
LHEQEAKTMKTITRTLMALAAADMGARLSHFSRIFFLQINLPYPINRASMSEMANAF